MIDDTNVIYELEKTEKEGKWFLSTDRKKKHSRLCHHEMSLRQYLKEFIFKRLSYCSVNYEKAIVYFPTMHLCFAGTLCSQR